MCPIEAHFGRAEAYQSGGNSIGRLRESAEKVKTEVAAGLGAAQRRTENFQPELGLAHGGAEIPGRIEGASRFGERREVLIVDRAARAKNVEQRDPGKPYAVFGAALDLGLILVQNLAAQKLLVLFETRHARSELRHAFTQIDFRRSSLIQSRAWS